MHDNDSQDEPTYDEGAGFPTEETADREREPGRQEPTLEAAPHEQEASTDDVPAVQPLNAAAKAASAMNWWLPDGLNVFLGGWTEEEWTQFLGFEDVREVQDFCLRGLDMLGRSSETHSLSRLQSIRLAMSVPYVRTNVFAREEPAKHKDWVQRCFGLYAEGFSLNSPKPAEVLRLPTHLQACLGWQVAPAMRKLRESTDHVAGVLKHVLRTLKEVDKLSEVQRGIFGLGLLALCDAMCSPELMQHALQECPALAQDFPRMHELEAHTKAYRRNMPVSLQVMLGTASVLAEDFASDLREFADTGSDPAMCYDKLRDVQSLVDTAVDMTQHALPALMERTLEEHVMLPARSLVREGVTPSVMRAARVLLDGSQAMIERTFEGVRFGNILEHPWKRWSDDVLAAMRACVKAQDQLEKQVLEKAKDPVKNLRALQELAQQVDAFENGESCRRLIELLAREPEAAAPAGRRAEELASAEPAAQVASQPVSEHSPGQAQSARDPMVPGESSPTPDGPDAPDVSEAPHASNVPATQDPAAESAPRAHEPKGRTRDPRESVTGPGESAAGASSARKPSEAAPLKALPIRKEDEPGKDRASSAIAPAEEAPSTSAQEAESSPSERDSEAGRFQRPARPRSKAPPEQA